MRTGSLPNPCKNCGRLTDVTQRSVRSIVHRKRPCCVQPPLSNNSTETFQHTVPASREGKPKSWPRVVWCSVKGASSRTTEALLIDDLERPYPSRFQGYCKSFATKFRDRAAANLFRRKPVSARYTKLQKTKVLERALYDSAAVICRKMAREKYF